MTEFQKLVNDYADAVIAYGPTSPQAEAMVDQHRSVDGFLDAAETVRRVRTGSAAEPLMRQGKILLDADARDFLIWREGMGRTVEIYDIQVGSERRKGRGRRLVEILLEMPHGAALVFALTRWDNTIAHQFYENLGFRMVGRMHYFYRDMVVRDFRRKIAQEHAMVWGRDL